MISFETERLRGKSFSEADQKAVVEILRDEVVSRTYMVPEIISDEAAVPLFSRLRQLSQREDHYVVGLYREETLIGWINDTEQGDRMIELGYVLHPRYYGQGYMTEALRAAIRELFARGYQEIVAGAFEENIASIRVMEKCGMTRIDRQEEIEYRGHVHRCVYYAIGNTGK